MKIDIFVIIQEKTKSLIISWLIFSQVSQVAYLFRYPACTYFEWMNGILGVQQYKKNTIFYLSFSLHNLLAIYVQIKHSYV